jgi:hypothetical protein
MASSDFRNPQNNVAASALIKTRLQPDDHMFIEIATWSIDCRNRGAESGTIIAFVSFYIGICSKVSRAPGPLLSKSRSPQADK